jgi:hypothetical protein
LGASTSSGPEPPGPGFSPTALSVEPGGEDGADVVPASEPPSPPPEERIILTATPAPARTTGTPIHTPLGSLRALRTNLTSLVARKSRGALVTRYTRASLWSGPLFLRLRRIIAMRRRYPRGRGAKRRLVGSREEAAFSGYPGCPGASPLGRVGLFPSGSGAGKDRVLMPTSVPRPRHSVPGWLLVLLRPLFRYSVTRDAYVLRAVGNRRGPVLRC